MAALTHYSQAAVINALLRATNLTAPTTVYLGLLTTVAANDNGTNTEVTGGSYARVACTWTAPSNQTDGANTQNAANIVFPQATALWGNMNGWIVTDAPTGGNTLYYGSFTTVKQVASGDTYEVLAGSIVLTQH